MFSSRNALATPEGKKLGFVSTEPKDSIATAPTDDKDLAGKQHTHLEGDFSLVVDEVTGITGLQVPEMKDVTARVRVKIQQTCFPEPLPLFTAPSRSVFTVAASRMLDFKFRKYDDGWRAESQILK